MGRQARITCALGLVALIGSGCASWKHTDAGVGRALTPGVSAVTVEGRKLLRLRGRVSSALIDPDGGRVVDFHLAPPAKWFFVDDPDDPDRKRVVVEDAPPIGATSPATWEVSFTPTNDTLEHATYWQADVSPARVVLLSDKAGGLRCRKEFQLRRTGELDIAVSVRNVSGKAVDAQFLARMGVAGILADEQPVADRTQAVFESPNPDEKWRLKRAWSSPALTDISSYTMGGGTGHAITFEHTALAPGGEIAWRETWTLTRGR